MTDSSDSDNPFASLDISFSDDEMASYEAQKKEEEANKPRYEGGLVRVRIEKKGRGGKAVTVFYDFDKHQKGKMKELLSELKKKLAVGGKLTDDGLELQGDQRKSASEWLQSQGYKIKGQIS